MSDRVGILVRVTVCAIAVVAMGAGAAAGEEAASWGERIEWGEDGPTAREHPSLMVFGDRVVVYSGSGYEPQGAPLGDAWAFDLTEKTWRELEIVGDAPSAAGSRRVAQAPGADHAFLFGGYGAEFVTNNELHRAELVDGALSFERIEQVDAPPDRALHAFAYDAERSALVVTHGVSRAGFLGDSWIGTFDGDGRVVWREVEGGAAPGPRFGSSYGFDSDRGELVMLSGQLPGAEGDPMPMTRELWALDVRSDPPAWEQVVVDELPEGRRNAMFAFDDATDRLVVWCGTADARTNVEGLVTVCRDERGEWRVHEQSDEGAPPRRSSGVGFADPGSGRFCLGFGNSREGRYTDWVTLEFAPAGE